MPEVGCGILYFRLSKSIDTLLNASENLALQLQPYLPEGSTTYVAELLHGEPLRLYISKPRSTKLGDYRPPRKTPYHRISVNNDLNPYAFLITVLHEIAHYHTYIAHKNKVKPHGQEWKNAFVKLLKPVVGSHIFPEEVCLALENYLQDPKASSCTDEDLMRVLHQYNKPDGTQLLEELAEGTAFTINFKRFFRKGPKARKCFECMDLHNRRNYSIQGCAPVYDLSERENI